MARSANFLQHCDLQEDVAELRLQFIKISVIIFSIDCHYYREEIPRPNRWCLSHHGMSEKLLGIERARMSVVMTRTIIVGIICHAFVLVSLPIWVGVGLSTVQQTRCCRLCRDAVSCVACHHCSDGSNVRFFPNTKATTKKC